MFLRVSWMHGERQRMWHTKFKIALVEKNTDALDVLLADMPLFSDPKEIVEAMYLLQEASVLLHSLKDEASNSMIRIKTNISFLNSTQPQSLRTLDIKS